MRSTTFFLSKRCIFRNRLNLLLLCMMLWYSSNAGAENNSNKISLQIIKGAAKVFQSGINSKFKLVLHKDEVDIGDTIETVKNSKARLVFSDGTIFKIKPLTKIKLLHGGLRFLHGSVWFKVFKKGDKFQIQTPTMIVGIRGTTFDIKVSAKSGASVIKVYEGTVFIKPIKKGTTASFLNKGLIAAVRKNSTSIELKKFNFAFASKEWNPYRWKLSKKSPLLKAFESYLRLKRDPETSNLAGKAYKIYTKLKNGRKIGFSKSESGHKQLELEEMTGGDDWK
ncbi:FecR domain-containing protein [Candidatus Riflebacteria bacterium]